MSIFNRIRNAVSNFGRSVVRVVNRVFLKTEAVPVATQAHHEEKAEDLSRIENPTPILNGKNIYHEMAAQMHVDLEAVETKKREEKLYKWVARRSGRPVERIKELDKQLDAICADFTFQDENQPIVQKQKSLSTAAAYQLNDLLGHHMRGIACTALLLRKHQDVLSIGSWAEVAKKSVEHAALVFGNKGISNGLLEERYLFGIASTSPEHAELILKKFDGRLGKQEALIKVCAEAPKQSGSNLRNSL